MTATAPFQSRRIGFQPKPKPEPIPPYTRVHTCGGLLTSDKRELGTEACLAAFEARLRAERPHPPINGLPPVRPTNAGVEFGAWYGYAHDTYSVSSNEPAIIRRLTAALLAATSLPAGAGGASEGYDWPAIRTSYAFVMLARVQDHTSHEYCAPESYSVVRPAASDAHRELSDVLRSMRPIPSFARAEQRAAAAAELEQLQEQAYRLRQQIWKQSHPLVQERPAGPGVQATLF
jgi:hypothetical protein